MGTMAILSIQGDEKIKWDAGDIFSVEEARRKFNDLRKQGYYAYALDRFGGKGKILHEFNPDLETILMAPPVRGG